MRNGFVVYFTAKSRGNCCTCDVGLQANYRRPQKAHLEISRLPKWYITLKGRINKKMKHIIRNSIITPT